MPRISLIHPSRSRPVKAKEAADKWISRAGIEVEYILSLDESDPVKHQYDLPNNKDHEHYAIFRNNRSAIDAINAAAAESTGDIFIQMADDFDCPENWGLKIIEATQGKTDWILKTQDGTQGWIITLPIMDRVYYNRFGYVYNPEYLHMFCDTELTAVADLTGRKITSNIQFKHNHYSVTGHKPDEVSQRADATWAQGERLFIERYKKNFGLTEIKGKIEDQSYTNWIKGKL